MLYRLLPRSAGGLGHLGAADLNPDFVVLMLGINNTWAAEEPVVDSILAGVQAVIASVHERKPRAHIVFLQSILPTNDPQKNQTIVLPANERLRSSTGRGVRSGHWLRAQAAYDREVAQRELAPELKMH